MNLLKNEKGGALIIVFFILTLFIILAYTLANQTMQSVKQRTFAEDEVQGKLLADAGLAYLQEYLEANLKMPHSFNDRNYFKESDPLLNSLEQGNAGPVAASEDDVTALVDKIASRAANTYKPIDLDGLDGSFAINYQVEKRIPRVTEVTTQPYVLMLKVSVIGIPNRAELNRRVRLDSTVYINTIPAPFHYAVSTPGQLRLFGGSNIIGNIAADSLVTSTSYRYSVWENSKTEWYTGIDAINKSYVEGEIFLPESNRLLFSKNVPAEEPDGEPFSGESLATAAAIEDRFIPVPFPEDETVSSVILSADPKTPYKPGYAAPVITIRKDAAQPLFADEAYTVKNLVEEQIKSGGENADQAKGELIEVAADESYWFMSKEEAETKPGFITATVADGIDSLVILPPVDTGQPFVNLTARFTGDSLEEIRRLYIGRAGEDAIATVEMGRKGSFESTPSANGEPFKFNGTIYIKGNLDIVGDVDINGTVYVDGNVVVREIENVGDQNNLVIMASGTISLTDRYRKQKENAESDAIKPLRAFLYSESAMELYSYESHNRIIGGIATGMEKPLQGEEEESEAASSYLELDASRIDDKDNRYPTRMVVRFDRNIFESETPGLPAGDRFHIDIYDREYPEVGEPIIAQENE